MTQNDEYEKSVAKLEAARNKSSDEYFKARPQIDNHDRRKIFDAGYERGYKAALSEPETVTLPAHIKSIKIPTITMEQEFQAHYRRGFEAGKNSVTLPDGWIAIPIEADYNQIDAIVKELRICRARLLKTAARCIYDTVIASAPKLNEKG